jgi:hypothetical protein
MMTHIACVEHYKRGLLAYTIERVERLKHLLWYKHQVPADVINNLAPVELDFLRQYQQNLKRFADACDLRTDLTIDAAPPKCKCVQVRQPSVHMTSQTNRILPNVVIEGYTDGVFITCRALALTAGVLDAEYRCGVSRA